MGYSTSRSIPGVFGDRHVIVMVSVMRRKRLNTRALHGATMMVMTPMIKNCQRIPRCPTLSSTRERAIQSPIRDTDSLLASGLRSSLSAAKPVRSLLTSCEGHCYCHCHHLHGEGSGLRVGPRASSPARGVSPRSVLRISGQRGDGDDDFYDKEYIRAYSRQGMSTCWLSSPLQPNRMFRRTEQGVPCLCDLGDH